MKVEPRAIKLFECGIGTLESTYKVRLAIEYKTIKTQLTSFKLLERIRLPL